MSNVKYYMYIKKKYVYIPEPRAKQIYLFATFVSQLSKCTPKAPEIDNNHSELSF